MPVLRCSRSRFHSPSPAATLVNTVTDAEIKEVEWDCRDAQGNPVGTCVYFYSLRTGYKVLTRRMVLLK